MYTALYRAERPEIFSEILGQEHIVKILKHQINTDTVNHAYLFCGTRGTGKTTTARILAKAVNCTAEGERPCGTCPNCMSIKNGTFMDVIEIDAASNNGVENIRELKESVKYPPTVGRKKVYIIDEVHMLSQGAFNALLKTLEEPPQDVMFILATTEPQKLPATILSRCIRLDFKRVPQRIIYDGMKRICDDRDIEITDGALKLLSNCADGSVRDGLSVLDQVISGGDKTIDREKVLEYIGTVGEDFFIELTELVSLKKVDEALVLLDEALSDGKDVKQLMKDWTAHYRNLLITKFIKNPEDLLNMSTENIQKIKAQTEHISLEDINNAIIKLSKTMDDARWSTQPRILLELAIVNIATDLIDDRKLQQRAKSKQQNEINAIPIEKEKQKPISKASDKSQIDDVKQSEQITQPLQPKLNITDQNKKIWQEVFEEGEDEAGSFNLIRIGTELYELAENAFTIIANTKFTQKFVEQKRDQIESIMSAKFGHKMQMICKLASEISSKEANKNSESAEDIAQKASEALGIDIDFE